MEERKNFIRNPEDFICDHCGFKAEGSGYTNHCSRCLWSKHVDNLPGDRKSPCGGLMEPIALEIGGDKEQIVHHCHSCGIIKKNKVATNDNRETILKLPIQ